MQQRPSHPVIASIHNKLVKSCRGPHISSHFTIQFYGQISILMRNLPAYNY